MLSDLQILLQMENVRDCTPFLTFSVPTHMMLVVLFIIMAAWPLDIGVTLWYRTGHCGTNHFIPVSDPGTLWTKGSGKVSYFITHTYAHTHMHTHSYMHICMYMCKHLYLYMNAHIFAHACVHRHTCIYSRRKRDIVKLANKNNPVSLELLVPF